MKKEFVGPLVTVIILIVLSAFVVYSYVLINRVGKKMNEIQVTAANDASRIDGIVNLINSNLNAQNNK